MSEEVIQEKQEKIATKAPMPPVATLLVIGVFIIIVLAFVYVCVARNETTPLPDTTPIAQSDVTVALPSDSLGGEIYEKQQNPLEDKLPEQTPVANPIGDAYKNPFE
jgi:hypothetical protein